MSDVAIRVENLSKEFRIGTRQIGYATFRDKVAKTLTAPFRASSYSKKAQTETFWALKDISFQIKCGEVVGIIGRNGAGKSTLLKILSRITEPTSGYAEIHGRVSSLLEVGTGFHAELTGRENIFLNGAILGMKRTQIARQFDEMVAFAEVEKFIDTPLKHYSTGMYLRLAFAVAAHLEPELLLVDEVLAVGDTAFQKKCIGKMEDVAKAGRTVLFVSHNMAAVRALCTNGIVLSQGRVVESGDLNRSIEYYYKSIGALPGAREEQLLSSEGDRSQFGAISIDGAQGNTVTQSQEFKVSTTLRIDENVSGFSVFCILEDMQSRTIFHLREESSNLGIGTVQPGKYDIGVEFPALWLNPGLYSVYFKVLFWGESTGDRHLSDRFPLDVEGTNSTSGAILNPRVEWTVGKTSQELPRLEIVAS